MTVRERGAEAAGDLYWRAEILQALFWMRGEGLAEAVEPEGLADFLNVERATLAEQLEQLSVDGYVEPWRIGDAARGYRLTDLGLAEGARSFRDEFDDLTNGGHYACAPGCWCHDPDHAGDACPSEPSEPGPGRGGERAGVGG